MDQANDLQAQLARLEQVTHDLKHQYGELGTLQATEVTNRAQAWLNSQDPTVNGRRDYSAHMTAETKAEILQLQGDIAAGEVERDTLKVRIDLIAKGFIS